MHFQVLANDINQGMSMVIRALSARPVKTVYEGVFLETKENGLHLTCTDGQMTICTVVPAMVKEEGFTLMPAKLFSDLLKKLDGEIDIQVDEKAFNATIKAMGSSTRMVTMNPVDFPEFLEMRSDFVATLSQKQFAAAIGHVTFALSSDETRKILTGCLMEIYPEEMRFVCVDGYRLAMQRVYTSHSLPEGKEMQSAILPGTIILEISRMVEDVDEEIKISCSMSQMTASFSATTVYCPLIPGEYINYNQILPLTWTTSIKVNRAELIGAIERASLIARQGDHVLRIQIEEQEMVIQADTEMGKAKENLPILFEGAPLNISFKDRYLLEAIRNTEHQEISLRFNTNVSPCVICPVKGNQYTYLLLPVRTIE